jgi:outer membrane protein OmpA-like peptidoglycan-associated protein
MRRILTFACIILETVPVLAQSGSGKNIKISVQNAKPQQRYMQKVKSKEQPVKIFYYGQTKTFKKCVDDKLPPRPIPKGYGLSKLKCKCAPDAGGEIEVMYIAPGVLQQYLKNTPSYQTYCANHTIYVQGKSELLIRVAADSIDTNDELIKSYALKAINKNDDSYASIQFNQNSAQLTVSSYAVLDVTSIDLKKFTDKKIELDGYTGNEGTAAHNKMLAGDRANTIKTFLVRAGIDAKRIKVRSYGESHPIADNSTEEGRMQNRRVEFKQR